MGDRTGDNEAETANEKNGIPSFAASTADHANDKGIARGKY